MTTKSALIIGTLALASLGIASAKTFDLSLDSPTKVGSAELKAGKYRVKVDGSQAVFTDTESDKTYTTAVKVDQSDKKFDQTMIQTHSSGNGAEANLFEIDLGGSTTKLEFGE